MVAEVIINSKAKQLNRTFDYNIPKEMEELILIGSKVLVPFGKINLFIMGLFSISLMIFKYAINFIKKWQNYRREQ